MLRKVLLKFSAVTISKLLPPSVKLSSIRMFLALATHSACEFFQVDATLAYLNVDLEDDVYVEQAPSFEIPGKG